MLEAHDSAIISSLADIDTSSRGTRICVGRDSMIDSFVRIKCAGGTDDVIIGERCFVNSGTVIYTGNGIQIGNDVLIAANCTFAPVNHSYHARKTTIREQGFLPGKGGIVIEDDVWIGAGCVILDGATIRRGAVIAACSLVRGELNEYGIYAGTPLVRKGERT